MTRDRGSAVRGRWWAFLVLATAAHAVALASLHPEQSPPRRAEAQPALVVDTDLTIEAAEEALPVRHAVEPSATHPVARGFATAVVADTRGHRNGERAAAESVPAAPPNGEDSWAFAPGRRDAFDVVSPATVARAARGVLAPSEHRSTTGGVVEALDSHDAALGLGRGGPVLSAIEEAAATDDAPLEGAATFDIEFDAQGRVSIALREDPALLSGWAKVGEAARSAIDPARLRLPPGVSRWHVVVHVEAKREYPSGLDPKRLGTELHASPTGVTLTSVGKVCNVRVTLGLTLAPIMGGCELVNLGAHPLRVVHGYIVEEGRL